MEKTEKNKRLPAQELVAASLDACPKHLKEQLLAKLDELETLLANLDEPENGKAFAAWRRTPPAVGQKVLAAILGTHGSGLSAIEIGVKPLAGRTLDKLRALALILRREKEEARASEEMVRAMPDLPTDLSPEQRLGKIFTDFCGIYNSLHPSLGRNLLEPRFETLLIQTEAALAPLHKQAVQLSRNATNQRTRHARDHQSDSSGSSGGAARSAHPHHEG